MSSPPHRDALRLLWTPKWVGLTLLVLVASIVFAAASSWQYQRAMDQVTAQRATAEAPQPVETLVPDGSQVPSGSLGRLAVVQGAYVADAWVTGRASPDGEPGVWLVSAVDDGSGLLTPVLRGWLAQKAPQQPASGDPDVVVTGRVSSSENFYTGIPAAGRDELVAITTQGLAEIWQQPLRAGYLVLTEQVPALVGDPVPVPPVFGVADDVAFPWQNAGYAAQWIAFIGFTGFMYWRLFSDDLQRMRERRHHEVTAAAQPVISRASGADLP